MWAGAMGLALALGAGVAPARAVLGRQQDALPDTNAIPPAMIAQGRAIFHGRGSCFACHGASLEGGPIAPTLKPHPWKDARGGTLAAIYAVITHGVPGSAMAARPGGIGDADAVRVAAYIWSVGHRGVAP